MLYYTVLCLCVILSSVSSQYKPTWDSLDSRPLPEWYDKAKVGIFLHWGIYSVPSLGSEWFWSHWQSRYITHLFITNFIFYILDNDPETIDFIKKNYPPDWTYQDFAQQLTAEFYDPFMWVNLFLKSGAKYKR